MNFANIAAGFRKVDLNGDEFPALGELSKQQREDILMSNLLGTSKTAGAGDKSPVAGERKPLKEKYGLLGLIEVIKMTNPDLSMLSLGCDLTTLGMDLSSTDNVYARFMTPFSDTPAVGSEPTFPSTIAYCQMKTIPPAISKIPKFSDETLFYVFYSMPRDILQEASAQELYKRNWRFHKEFKLWLTKDKDSEVLQKGSDFERGVYVFFDPSSWTRVKKEWILYFDQLEERNLELDSSKSWSSPTGAIFASMIREKRLIKELKDFTAGAPPGINLVKSDDLREWLVDIEGAPDSLFANEVFTVRIRFNSNYPMESPEVVFLPTKCPVHPHVYSNGHICLSILYDQWTPALTASTICISLQSMLSSCTEKVRPVDNDRYIKTAAKSPKDSNWAFHDDKV